jgi:hypothetical protein
MKVYVRHGEGELMFPSFRDFADMYRLKFVAPDDLVRRETSSRWVRAADLPELRVLELGRRGRSRDLRRMLVVVALLSIAAAVVVRLSTLPPGPAPAATRPVR